jgi:hypothetical protein
MKAICTKPNQEPFVFECATLSLSAYPHIWEDTFVNDMPDEHGALIPCRSADGITWEPIISIDTGRILHWKQGVTAEVRYKVCDECDYTLYDRMGNKVFTAKDAYVPTMLCPKENGFGDYMMFDVDADGFIQQWAPSGTEMTWYDEEEDMEIIVCFGDEERRSSIA